MKRKATKREALDLMDRLYLTFEESAIEALEVDGITATILTNNRILTNSRSTIHRFKLCVEDDEGAPAVFDVYVDINPAKR